MHLPWWSSHIITYSVATAVILGGRCDSTGGPNPTPHLSRRVAWGSSTTDDRQNVASEKHLNNPYPAIVEATAKLRKEGPALTRQLTLSKRAYKETQTLPTVSLNGSQL